MEKELEKIKQVVTIQTTVGSMDEARHIARHLVEKGLVACAQIIPWVESNYLWNGQLMVTQESLLVLKTFKKQQERVCQSIEAMSSYEIPMISVQEVSGMNVAYAGWMEEVLVE